MRIIKYFIWWISVFSIGGLIVGTPLLVISNITDDTKIGLLLMIPPVFIAHKAIRKFSDWMAPKILSTKDLYR